MPLRQRADLWHSMSGVVAAYQPVRAPGPLLARYNMAHGGDNRYRAINGTATDPSWVSNRGWNVLANYLLTGWVPVKNSFTVLVAYTGGAGAWGDLLYVYNAGYTIALTQYSTVTNKRHYEKGGAYDAAVTGPARGVLAISGDSGYLDGALEVAAIGTNWGSSNAALQIGNTNCSTSQYIRAVACVARPASAAEVWQASRQMAYCDVNPEWSVWGRRRQWFYGPQVGGFQAAWARGSNVVLRGGP